LVQIVDDDLRNRITLDFDDDPGVFVRFVSDRGDISQDFFIHQFSDARHEQGPVHVVRNFGNDDLLASAFDFFQANFAPHLKAASATVEVIADAIQTTNHAAGGKIRTFDVLHELFQGDVRIIDLRDNTIN